MPIYTKTGDQGETFLGDGSRTQKIDTRIELVGLLDELNSHIGFLLAGLKKGSNDHEDSCELLELLQSLLFTAGAQIANPKKKSDTDALFDRTTRKLEETIDALETNLAPLQNFILPGGSEKAARAHLCRTLARKIERAFFRIQKDLALSPALGRFLNRLSDYFFVLARYCNQQENVPDVIWKKE